MLVSAMRALAEAGTGDPAAARIAVGAWVLAARTWLGTLGRPVLVRAVPTWVGLSIVAGVTMQGNAVSAADLVELARSSAVALTVMALAWLLLSAGAVRAGLDAPGTSFLRALPGGPPLRTLALGSVTALAHLPWAAIWTVGGGVAAGGVAWAAMTAGSLAVVVAGARLELAPRAPRWRTALAALVGVHARSLLRRRRAVLLAGAGLAAVGGLLAGLLIARGALDGEIAAVVIAVAASIAVPAALAAATTAAATSDREVGWLVAASGRSRGVRRFALALVLVTIGAAAGAVVALAALAIAAPAARTLAWIVGAALVVGAGLGLAALGAAGWADRRDRIDGGRVVVALIGQALVAVTLVGIFDGAGVAAVLAGGLAIALGGGR